MTTLIASDLHLSGEARDAHRWGLFQWLRQKANQHDVDQVLLLGDLTIAKDYHSAAITNRLVDELSGLADVNKVFVLMGNHDFVDRATPFFRFLSRIKNLRMILEPETHELVIGKRGAKCLFLPCTRHYQRDWAPWFDKLKTFDFIFCHQTFGGALAENGVALDGIPISLFDGIDARVFSGDVHVPQAIGSVTYVGAPYRIKFGDRYQGRVIHIDKRGAAHDLHYPCANRHLVEGSTAHVMKTMAALPEGDQVKIVVALPRSEYVSWPAIKDDIMKGCQLRKLDVCGIALKADGADGHAKIARRVPPKTPSELVDRYAQQHALPDDVRGIGQALLKEDGRE